MNKEENTVPEMAILVIGFDGYSDLWGNYFKLLNKYWEDRRYPTYLSNNILEIEYDNVTTINCGKEAEWSRKVQNAIEVIEQKYVCLLLEDFFTGDYVDSREIEEILKCMNENQLKYYKLNTFSNINTQSYKNVDYLKTIPKNLPYGISLQPAIWEKTYLKELLGSDNYNAWVFEFDRVKDSNGKSSEPIPGCVYDTRNVLQIQHGVVQGKYLPKVITYFEKKGEPLDTTHRREMNFKEYFIYKLKLSTKAYMPEILIEPTKKIMKIFGMQFVSDKYKARE